MASPESKTVKRPFPRDEDAFKLDDRIAFDKEADTYILEDHENNGKLYEWNARAQSWTEQISEADIKAFQDAYGGNGTDDKPPGSAEPDENPKKRSLSQDDDNVTGSSQKAPKKSKQDKPQKKNTGLYVKNVPKDVTVQELYDTFSKYGVIAESIDDRTPRIKIYKNDDGTPKGDALIVYHRPESIFLAIDMLDDTDFRYGQKLPEGPMVLSLADNSFKKTNVAGAEQKSQGQEKQQQHQLKKKGGLSKEQHKAIKANENLDSKLADWSDEEPQQLKLDPKKAKIAILSKAFDLTKVQEDPQEAVEIKEDLLDECEKFGEVTNLTLWDLEEDGIVTIRFREDGSALLCVNSLRGRGFDGRKLEASLGTGREKFRKMKKGDLQDDEDERLAAMATS